MAWVEQTMNYCSLDARFAEGGVSMEDFGHGESGHTIVIEPLTQEDAHSYAFILRKCAQHLERVGRGLPTREEEDELNAKIMGNSTREPR